MDLMLLCVIIFGFVCVCVCADKIHPGKQESLVSGAVSTLHLSTCKNQSDCFLFVESG